MTIIVSDTIGLACLWMVKETKIVSKQRKRMTMMVSTCHRTWLPLDDERETTIVSFERHWVFDQRGRWPYLSVRAIGLDCLWMTKGRPQQSWLKESSTKGADDHICLCMPSNLIVSGWQKGDRNSLDWKTLSLRQREQMTTFVSACHRTWLSLDDEGENLIVSIERHWVSDKGSRWPYLSLRAIGLDCL